MKAKENLPLLNGIPVKYASFNARMLASTIDTFIITLLAFPIIDFFCPPVSGDIFYTALTSENTQDTGQLLQALMGVVKENHLIERSIIVNLAQLFFIACYTFFFWERYHSTPGKMFLRIEIRDLKTMELMTRKQEIKRFLGYILSFAAFSMGFIWILLNRKKQGWHDKIAGTIVIAKPKKPKLKKQDK